MIGGTDGTARGEPNVFGLSRVVTSGDDVKRFGKGVEALSYTAREGWVSCRKTVFVSFFKERI